MKKSLRNHVTDALAYAMAKPFGDSPLSPSSEPIHDGSFFTLDRPHIDGCDLNIRIGSTTDEGDVEVTRAEVEELHVALGKWLHDTTQRTPCHRCTSSRRAR